MKRQLEVAAIDVGFGTTCVASGITYNQSDFVVFPSRAVKVNPEEVRRLESFGTAQRDTTFVEVDGEQYEVGPGVLYKAADANERQLNKRYISSPAYKALFRGGLSQIKANTIDLLVGGLPLNQLQRKEELIDFMVGEHRVGDRVITVKQAHVLPQPLGALTYYAKEEARKHNCDIMKILGTSTRVTVDPGYGTFDFLTSSGLAMDEDRSNAFELGQGKILRRCSDYLSKQFDVYVGPELVDRGFANGELEIFGESYPFPNADNEYNCIPIIDGLCNEAIDLLSNIIGDAADIKEFVVSGGPGPDFVRALQRAFPRHTVKLINKHHVAFCLGLAELARQIAGVSKNQAA